MLKRKVFFFESNQFNIISVDSSFKMTLNILVIINSKQSLAW